MSPARLGRPALLLGIGILVVAGAPAASPRDERASRDWHPLRTEKARIVYVNDGDTVTVRLQDDPTNEKERVRLIGIDVPETNDVRAEYKTLALDARRFATDALKGRVVTLERDAMTENRDGFGRLLRYVVLSDGTNFNEEMIRRGYGRVYRRFRFSLKERFLAAEGRARAARIGYWTLPPGPPRKTRSRRNRGRPRPTRLTPVKGRAPAPVITLLARKSHGLHGPRVRGGDGPALRPPPPVLAAAP